MHPLKINARLPIEPVHKEQMRPQGFIASDTLYGGRSPSYIQFDVARIWRGVNAMRLHDGRRTMAWLIAAIVFIVPLVFFPRAVGYMLLVALVLLGGWALYESLVNRQYLADEEKVKITALYDPVACALQTPVSANVVNDSDREVASVRFDIALKRRGYSNEIGRLSRLLDDQPMPPGARSHYCYALPVLIPPVNPDELEFVIPLQFVTFK